MFEYCSVCDKEWRGTRLNALLAGWVYRWLQGVGKWFCSDCSKKEKQ